MSNIGEAQIIRITRERLAAIKKFLPVRDSFRDNLQARQQAKMDFTTDTQQLFTPITEATEKVVTAIKESHPVFEVKPVETIDIRNQELRDKFEEGFLTTVDNADAASLVNFTVSDYNKRYTHLKPGSKRDCIGTFSKWIDVIYKIKTGLNQIDRKDDALFKKISLTVNLAKMEVEKRTEQLKEQAKQIQKQTKPTQGRKPKNNQIQQRKHFQSKK